jgi:two-component system chemotaxis response regulator CheB
MTPAAVVMGGSAGGVRACIEVLAALPAELPAAIVVLLHLPAGQPSVLPAVFAPHAAVPVVEAEDKAPVTPGRIYVAPPDYHLQIEPGRTFSLSADMPVNFSRPSIDVLFESAAAAYGSELLGIVLTGASDDGAAGLRAIRDAGGRAWVQDPADAEVTLMPQSALRGTDVEAVLPAAALGSRLAGLFAHAGRAR